MEPTVSHLDTLAQTSQEPIFQITNDLPDEDKLNYDSDDESIGDRCIVD